MLDDEELDKMPPAPMNIVSMLEAKQAKCHFDKMPQVLAYEIHGETLTFHWLNNIIVTVKRSYYTTPNGFKGGRVRLIKIEDRSQDPTVVLGHFEYGKIETHPERGSEAETIFKRVILSYN